MNIPRSRPARWMVAALFFGGIAAVGLAAHWTAPALSAGPMLQNATPDGFTVVWWRSGHGPAELRVRGSADAETTFPARRTGDRFEARAADLEPGASGHEALKAAFLGGLDVRRFELREPSLHDAFIGLTGDRPDRDPATEGAR